MATSRNSTTYITFVAKEHKVGLYHPSPCCPTECPAHTSLPMTSGHILRQYYVIRGSRKCRNFTFATINNNNMVNARTGHEKATLEPLTLEHGSRPRDGTVLFCTTYNSNMAPVRKLLTSGLCTEEGHRPTACCGDSLRISKYKHGDHAKRLGYKRQICTYVMSSP